MTMQRWRIVWNYQEEEPDPNGEWVKADDVGKLEAYSQRLKQRIADGIALYRREKRLWNARRSELTTANERLRKRVEYLEAFITDIPCDCEDKHGYPRSHQCARCCALNNTKGSDGR